MQATCIRRVRLLAPLSGVRIASPVEPSGSLAPGPPGGPTSDPPEASPATCEAELAELLERLIRSLEELDQRRRQNLQEMQQVAVELSLLVASHILQQQLSQDTFPIEPLVMEAIERLAPHEPIEVRLHPQDLQMMERQMADRLPAGKLEQVRLLADPSLARGSCLANAAEFGLLSSLEQRMANVRQLLLEGLEDAEIERRQTGAATDSLRRFPDRRETA